MQKETFVPLIILFGLLGIAAYFNYSLSSTPSTQTPVAQIEQPAATPVVDSVTTTPSYTETAPIAGEEVAPQEDDSVQQDQPEQSK